jgi:hypothetical protein
MRPIRSIIPGVLLLPLIALAGCGQSSTARPSTQPAPAPASSTGPAAPASPGPAANPAASPAAPADRVLSARVAYPWHWPNDTGQPASIQHSYPVPPLPLLIAIGAGDHPATSAERRFNRITFTFSSAFPSYQIRFGTKLVSDPSGRLVPLAGDGVLQVTFHQAQAHTASGAPSLQAQPPAHLGYRRMTSWALAGDNEGVLSYGIGISWPDPQAKPRFAVRAIEIEKVTPQGRHRYVVAIDIDATS